MGDPGPILTGRRVAVVLVVSGLVLGATGAVRVADVAPEPGGPPPGYDPGGSPAATVEAGVAALTAHDRVLTRTVSVREPPDAEARVTRETVVRFDPADREVSSVSYWHDPDPAEGDPAWTLRGRYVSETADVTHLAGIESSSRPSLARLRTATEGWLVRPSLDLAYAPTDPGSGAWPSLESVPPDTFAVVESGADRVVLETRSVDAFRNLEGYDPDRVVDGYLRVVVDPDTGYPTRVVSHRVTVDRNADGGEPRRRVTHEVTRIERRPVDVTRPPGAPGKGLVEYLYDALVY